MDVCVLQESPQSLAGVGPALNAKLNKCGIYSVQDLLFHLPLRYQDRTRITSIQDLRADDFCVIEGHICKTEIKPGKRPVMYCYVEDKTGILPLRFFNFYSQQLKIFQNGLRIRAFGEVRLYANAHTMIHPQYQLIGNTDISAVDETLTPIYPSTEGLTQARLRQLIQSAIHECQDALNTMEWMTNDVLHGYGFLSIREAIQQLHNPPPDISLQSLEMGQHPALKRLAFDELLAQRLSMQFARKEREALQAPCMTFKSESLDALKTMLPFSLTAAQQRVYKEIAGDLAQQKPMLRLVQGDVGSGKTVVAACAAIQAIANDYQVALMAPTDILTEQHAQTLTKWLAPLNIRIDRLSGKMTAKTRKETLLALKNHDCQLVIGTHALFQETVSFAQLGLVIIDEQHRFGVQQRLLLQQKGIQQEIEQQTVPHQLLMTATPIPRTLAMTQLSHLDISSIDELPPGRTPVITAVMNQNKRDLIINRLQQALALGRQAYWVCTLIEESETLQSMAATVTAEQLQAQLPNTRIGLIHGRMKGQEKEDTMMAFKRGEIHILVATTVIEVGVDVANASLMIIDNAERLGLSQLHQLRGRVGRGSVESHCLLLYQSPLSQQGRERLQVMRATCDGFIIAEKDLELRGAGEVLGVQQTGYRSFKIADLVRDEAMLVDVSKTAQQLLTHQPILAANITKRWLGAYEHFLQA
jgi:ATP-dependent DNA helicase RecG